MNRASFLKALAIVVATPKMLLGMKPTANVVKHVTENPCSAIPLEKTHLEFFLKFTENKNSMGIMKDIEITLEKAINTTICNTCGKRYDLHPYYNAPKTIRHICEFSTNPTLIARKCLSLN